MLHVHIESCMEYYACTLNAYALHVHMPSYASCRLQSTKSLRSLPCEKKSGASLEALPLPIVTNRTKESVTVLEPGTTRLQSLCLDAML